MRKITTLNLPVITFSIIGIIASKNALPQDNTRLSTTQCSIQRVNDYVFAFVYSSNEGVKLDSVEFTSPTIPKGCLSHKTILRIKDAYVLENGEKPKKMLIADESENGKKVYIEERQLGLLRFWIAGLASPYGCWCKALVSPDTAYFNFELERTPKQNKELADFKRVHNKEFNPENWMKIEADFLKGRECGAIGVVANEEVRSIDNNRLSSVTCSVATMNEHNFVFVYSISGAKLDSVEYSSSATPKGCFNYRTILKIKDAYALEVGSKAKKLELVVDDETYIEKGQVGFLTFKNRNLAYTHGCWYKALVSEDTVYVNFEHNDSFHRRMFDSFKSKNLNIFSRETWVKIERDFLRGEECY